MSNLGNRTTNNIELKELYRYLISNFAHRFSYNSLKKALHFGSSNTVKNYIEYLQETYFAGVINKFDFSLKKQISNDKKMYITDNAFVPLISMNVTNDKGWMLENMVYNSLAKNSEVYYYSATGECDFLTVKNQKIDSAIQVCFELNEQNRKRKINGLIETATKFDAKRALILTNDQEEELTIKNTKIEIKPVWKWMLKHVQKR